MIELIFWTSLALLLYTFIGYPLILKAISTLLPHRDKSGGSDCPAVSILLSVYNEEAVIREKIENFLALDYPEDKLELVIISDMCSDRTDDIIRSIGNPRVTLLVQTERSGKTKNLNRGAREATGDVLVFTDANAMYDRDAVTNLVRHFADPSIGLVTGKSVYIDPATGGTTSGGVYRRYEDFIKAGESRVVSIVGADGAIYAMRKTLYEELRPEYINDFIHTIQAVLKGYRAVSDDEAICREEADEDSSGEFRRQTRIMSQSWLIFLSQAGKLAASGSIAYLWALVSHKFLRWLTVPLMILTLFSSLLLSGQGLLFQAVFAGEMFFVILALCGMRLNSGISRVAYLFTLLHLASVFGLYKYLTGNMYTTWSPRNN